MIDNCQHLTFIVWRKFLSIVMTRTRIVLRSTSLESKNIAIRSLMCSVSTAFNSVYKKRTNDGHVGTREKTDVWFDGASVYIFFLLMPFVLIDTLNSDSSMKINLMLLFCFFWLLLRYRKYQSIEIGSWENTMENKLIFVLAHKTNETN